MSIPSWRTEVGLDRSDFISRAINRSHCFTLPSTIDIAVVIKNMEEDVFNTATTKEEYLMERELIMPSIAAISNEFSPIGGKIGKVTVQAETVIENPVKCREVSHRGNVSTSDVQDVPTKSTWAGLQPMTHCNVSNKQTEEMFAASNYNLHEKAIPAYPVGNIRPEMLTLNSGLASELHPTPATFQTNEEKEVLVMTIVKGMIAYLNLLEDNGIGLGRQLETNSYVIDHNLEIQKYREINDSRKQDDRFQKFPMSRVSEFTPINYALDSKRQEERLDRNINILNLFRMAARECRNAEHIYPLMWWSVSEVNGLPVVYCRIISRPYIPRLIIRISGAHLQNRNVVYKLLYNNSRIEFMSTTPAVSEASQGDFITSNCNSIGSSSRRKCINICDMILSWANIVV